MAILKNIELNNGVVVKYLRINSVQFSIQDVENFSYDEAGQRVPAPETLKYQLVVNYNSYVSEAKRRESSRYYIGSNSEIFEVTLAEVESEDLYQLAYRKLMEKLGGVSDSAN